MALFKRSVDSLTRAEPPNTACPTGNGNLSVMHESAKSMRSTPANLVTNSPSERKYSTSFGGSGLSSSPGSLSVAKNGRSDMIRDVTDHDNARRDDVLRRMLNTPRKPNSATPTKTVLQAAKHSAKPESTIERQEDSSEDGRQ